MSYPEKRDGGRLTGKWYGEVNMPRGKRFRRLHDSKQEADGYEAYVKATGIEPATADGAKFSGVTFRDVALLAIEAGGPKRAAWKSGRDASVRQRLDHCIDILGDIDIQAVGTPELDKLVTDLARRPGYQGRKNLSPATINRYLAAASAVLTFATQRGYRTGRPSVPLQRETGAREAIVSPALEVAVLKWMREHGYHEAATCCQVLIETGMRQGELQIVAAEQVENDFIGLYAAQCKTNKARSVYIREDLARDFRAVIAAGKRPDGYLLTRIFKRAAAACGGNSELVIHSLRHTRATRLLQAGVDPQVTMEMMGWTSFNTMKRYRHVSISMHVEAAKKVALQCGGNSENGAILRFQPRMTA